MMRLKTPLPMNPCKREFDAINYPSYVEIFEKLLPEIKDPFELWELYAEEYAHRPEFIHKYRYGFGFHGVHPLILYGQGAYGLRYVGRVFLAGAVDFDAARLLGFEPFATVEEALTEAENHLGKDCSILKLFSRYYFVYKPNSFSSLCIDNVSGKEEFQASFFTQAA